MLTWNPSLAIGVPAIDAQHQALFEHAARFEQALQRDASSAHLAELFGFLTAYARDHFAAEERLMREIGYPGLPEQIREHGEFTRRLALLAPLWEHEGESHVLLGMLRALLKTWLVEHITVSDQRICDFLRARAGSV